MNRDKILQEEVPSFVVELLKTYRGFYSTHSYIAEISLDCLKVIKTAIGVLINASYDFS
jgi:hypothetical protein